MNALTKIIAPTIVAAGIGASLWASKAFYVVSNIVDGDTFVTSDGQYIRFNKIDAPEINMCMGAESKEELSKLILNQRVYIRVHFIEKDRNRLIASVYSKNGNVEAMMLKKGLGILRGGPEEKDLDIATKYAQEKRLGVYSSTCTQLDNPINKSCNIKGNNRDGIKLYRYPGCKNYNSTIIQLYLGDEWFCSKDEAFKKGYTKGKDCL